MTQEPTVIIPTLFPTTLSTLLPTTLPTLLPTSLPTALPTSLPTALPTLLPTSLSTSLSNEEDSTDFLWSLVILVVPALLVTYLTNPDIFIKWYRCCCKCKKNNPEEENEIV